MYVVEEELAEMLDVSRGTVHKWMKQGGLIPKNAGPGKSAHNKRKQIPLRALLNYLHYAGILPFKSIEDDSVEEELDYRRFRVQKRFL